MTNLQVHPDNEDAFVREHADWLNVVTRSLYLKYPNSVDYDDFAQEALVGFLAATRSWDPARGCAFKTWARKRIAGQVVDGIRRDDMLSRRWREAATRVFKGDTEGMSAAEMHQVNLIRLYAQPTASLDTPLVHLIPDVNLTDVHAAIDADLTAEVWIAARTLPTRLQTILVLHYREHLTLTQIGQILGVTESRVSQLEKKACTAVHAQVLLNRRFSTDL